MTEHKHTTRRALIPGDAPCPWFEVVAGGHVVALTNHETIAYAGARVLNGEMFCNDEMLKAREQRRTP